MVLTCYTSNLAYQCIQEKEEILNIRIISSIDDDQQKWAMQIGHFLAERSNPWASPKWSTNVEIDENYKISTSSDGKFQTW